MLWKSRLRTASCDEKESFFFISAPDHRLSSRNKGFEYGPIRPPPELPREVCEAGSGMETILACGNTSNRSGKQSAVRSPGVRAGYNVLRVCCQTRRKLKEFCSQFPHGRSAIIGLALWVQSLAKPNSTSDLSADAPTQGLRVLRLHCWTTFEMAQEVDSFLLYERCEWSEKTP